VFAVEMEKLRQQVVTDIRLNQQLEADLNQMDIKIGLLVKNRITLQVINTVVFNSVYQVVALWGVRRSFISLFYLRWQNE